MTTNDHYDRILSLRALRSYSDEPVPDVLIERLLEAARWTGSSKNLQNWSFVVVDGEQKERLAACGDFTAPLRAAPIAFALVEEADGYEFDTGRAAQNVMLTATETGLGSCVIRSFNQKALQSLLNLPSHVMPELVISLGYPAKPAKIPGRRPIEDLVHWEEYGGRSSE